MSKKKKKSKKIKSHVKTETLEKNNEANLNIETVENEASENLDTRKNILREKEEEIEKERLRLIALNKSEEKDQVKESIQEKEEKLRKLLLERRELKKQLLKENEKQKTPLKEVVLNKKTEAESEVVVDDNFEYVDADRNVFKVFIDFVRYYTAKYIFRKNIERLEYVRKARHDHKFKILFSIIFTLIMITLLILFMRYFSTTKDTYGDYLPNNATTTTTVTTQSNSETPNSADNNSNNSSGLTEVANNEEAAANSSYNPGITLPVAKEIKTLEKLNTYQTSGWANKAGSVEKDTTLKVNAVSFPGGYMMYQIAEGQSAGQYISANPKLVEITANNDSMNFEFINYPLAVSVVEEQDIYEDKELTKSKGKTSANSRHNVKGYGVANNRLVYHLEDGTYLPFSGTVSQVQR